MGRTNPTYRDVVRATERRWEQFRRGLRRSDRPHFDRLFEHARAHADAGGYANHATPEEPILLSMLLEHEKSLSEHRAAVADQERRIAALEERVATLAAPEDAPDDGEPNDPGELATDAGGDEDGERGPGTPTAADGEDG